MQAFRNVEPAIWYALIRALVYVGGGAVGIALDPDSLEPILAGVGVLLGAEVVTTKGTRSEVYSPATMSDTLAQAFTGRVGTFIKTTVGNMVPDNKFTQALNAVLPVMLEFTNAQLTPEVQASIQRRVHLTLRAAGLTPKRTIPPAPEGPEPEPTEPTDGTPHTPETGRTSLGILLGILALTVILSACVPAQRFAGDVLDNVTGDQTASIMFVADGLEFRPGDNIAVGVNVDVLGHELILPDPLCTPTVVVLEPTPAMPMPLLGSKCLLGDLTEPYLIPFTGIDVSATAAWRRAGSSRIYHDIAE